jgi:hypothetical protein
MAFLRGNGGLDKRLRVRNDCRPWTLGSHALRVSSGRSPTQVVHPHAGLRTHTEAHYRHSGAGTVLGAHRVRILPVPTTGGGTAGKQ